MVGARGRILGMAVLVALPGTSGGSIRSLPGRPGQVTESKGLVLRLSEGTESAERPSALPAAQATTLSPSETAAVLSRLPALDRCPPTRRTSRCARSRCRRRARARRSRSPFPPPDGRRARPRPPRPARSRSLRHAPEGDVPLAPHLSVTFSQPMVAVTSHDDLAKAGVPVRLEPRAAGPVALGRHEDAALRADAAASRWRRSTAWRCRPARGPRPGGALAAAGALDLHDAARRCCEARHPADVPARREPILFASFDQKIDPAAVLAARSGSRPRDGAAPGHGRRSEGGRRREPPGRAGDRGPMARVRAGVAAGPRTRRSRSSVGPRHALGRGPAPDREGAGLDLPHVRRAARRPSTAAAGTASARPARPGRSSSRTRSTPRPSARHGHGDAGAARHSGRRVTASGSTSPGRSKGRTTYRVTSSPDDPRRVRPDARVDRAP